MSKPILLDTDVLVDFLRGHPDAIAYVKAQADRVVLSAVVAAELYAGVRDKDELTRLDDFLSVFRVIPVTAELARVAGLHKRDYHRSHGTGLADAIIAATVEAEKAELKTLNMKHYPMLKGLKPPYVKN
jgi:predicted nucleic acid-binding protein